MNLYNFDTRNTKFIYFALDAREVAEKIKTDLERKSMSIDLNDSSDKVSDILDNDVTSKSREILTGLNKSALIDDLSKQADLFEENVDPSKIEEYFKKYLQQKSLESLSAEELQKAMGDLAPEIGDLYLEANDYRFSAEQVNKDLSAALSNRNELQTMIYEDKSLRTTDKILDFLKSNLSKLPENIRDALTSGNTDLEENIKKGALTKLTDRFERREARFEKTEKEVAEMTENFAESVIGKDGWEKLDNDELLFDKESGYLSQYIEIKKQLSKMPEKVAENFHNNLLKKYTPNYRKQKGKIFDAQIEHKLEKSTEAVDSVLEKSLNAENPANLSKEQLNEKIKGELKRLDLFKNLPPSHRDSLDKKLNAMWEDKVDKFIKVESGKEDQKKAKESAEDKDKISREKMKTSWESWTIHLDGYKQDFNDAKDFQKSFIKKYFPDSIKDAEAYFDKHQNYAKSFEKSFQKYEKGQSAFFDKELGKVSAKLSDKKVSEAMKKSFKNAKSNTERRSWIKYLEKHVPLYEKSIQNYAKLEDRLKNSFKSLKNHPQIPKISGNFSSLQKNRKFLNAKDQYISPRDYEKDLKSLDKELSQIEKKDKEDRVSAEKNIAELSVKSFKLNEKGIKDKTDLARKSGIVMPDYLWKEFGEKQFWKKMDKIYPEYLEANDKSLEKSPSVNMAKEVVKNLDHEDLDFSRDFASQQSFNRQRHLRNQVSFSDEVWEEVKPDFQKKSETLYKKHQEIRKEMATFSKGISALNSANLDFDKDYSSLSDFSHQKGFFEFFKNQKVSNLAYDQLKNSEFTPKVLELYGEYLSQKNNTENSPETVKERKIIEDLSVNDLDISRDFASFSEFKRQPYLKKQVSFSEDIWKKVQPNFEQKALQLYSEHIQLRDEQKKFEKSLNTLTTEDLDTNFEDFAGFVGQPAMRKFFTEINISDMAYDALTDDFAAKMDELWESVKNSESANEFSDKDIQKLGTKHGLDFFNLPLENRENLSLKFERLDKLLTHSPSLANFFRKQEEHIAPVFLSFLGEMNNEDFKRLDDDLGTTEKSSSEIIDIFFNSPRRKYLLSEVRKNDSDAWRRLEIAERNFDGDLDIRGIVLNNFNLEDENLEGEFELDEDGNPIMLEEELVDDEENDEEESEIEKEDAELELDLDTEEESNEEEGEDEIKSREILNEEVKNTSKEELETLEKSEQVAESDETDELVELNENEDDDIESSDSEEEESEEYLEEVLESEMEEGLGGGEIISETYEEANDEIKSNEIEEINADEVDEKENEDEISRDLEKEENDKNSSEELDDETDKIEEIEDVEEERDKLDEEKKKEGVEQELEKDNLENDKKLEKEDIERTERKSREKILENIKKENLKESLEEKAERIKEEQEKLLRILRQDEFFQSLEKELDDEIAEDGDESSLQSNMSDDLIKEKSPINFSEIHCSGIMSLEKILQQVHSYLELLSEKKIDFQINLSEIERKREVKKSREVFLKIVNFILEKDPFVIEKVSFRAMSFSQKRCFLKSEIKYVADSRSMKFDIPLIERI